MRKVYILLLLVILVSITVTGQNLTNYIVIDQFGYLPDARKIAVIRNPMNGYDAAESFTPGSSYAVVNAQTGEIVFTGTPVVWKSGQTDLTSGDRAWHFDFTTFTEPGFYYIFDVSKNVRSFEFSISPNVYNEILKQAVRTFFYQRAGFAKEAEFAGAGWADGASHIGNLQDKNCRSFFDKNNPASEKDLSGGWYDAGDYNKYTSWTAGYVMDMMKAYLEKPDAWADDYNIPESGNGVPDLLDEAKWGIDHLLRMQEPNGSVLSIVGLAHGSPPSSATGPSYYGPANTSATLNTSAAFAIASKVYQSIGMNDYADTLVARAMKAWIWAEANPDSLFDNNKAEYNSSGLGAGSQEVDTYNREMMKLKAACYLFDITNEAQYKAYFDLHYTNSHLFVWNYAYPFEMTQQDVLLYYTTIEDGTPAVKTAIISKYRTAILTGADNMPAHTNFRDPYIADLKDYTWGSNSTKSATGNMFYDIISYNIDENSETAATNAALSYLNYLHGVNPLNFVYLSNMFEFGADNGVREFYHSWFSNKSPLWDRVGVSTYGPAPGFLTGGPNPSYDWDGCCPSGCGSANNNAICTSESITPPKGQPKQKSYKDFNTSWPLNSWSVTENSCGYQMNYIRLLSKFVKIDTDCNGDEQGIAFFDSCGICAGGNTGIEPSLDKSNCSPEIDCNGVLNGDAFIDSCGICAGGNTNNIPVLDAEICPEEDCNGDLGGTAFIDSCGVCAGGNTSIDPVLDAELCPVEDCNGDMGGTAFIDSCGNCADGQTGIIPVLDPLYCTPWNDCNGDLHGSAFIDSCGVCAGGNTGVTAILDELLCNVSVRDPNHDNFSIFPNPNEGLLNISFNANSYNLKIISLSGAIVYDNKLSGSMEIDISELVPGFYEMIIETANKVYRKKLVKL